MTPLTFHLIPHVHWDREWYLSRSAFLARLVPMMDALLELLESAPSLRFHLDGQMILVEDYLAVVPGARGTIEALARRGQLGLGPWYVLADELIPSGVSLRKNLEIGIGMARDLGAECPVLYSPDAFGHPAGLPDLAAEFGITNGVVWRGLGRVGGVERDLYRWEGRHGRSMVTYHLPPQGYEIGVSLPGDWAAIRRQLVARAVTADIAVFVGADHHAAAPDLPTLAERIQALEPKATVRFSSLPEYFNSVAASAPVLEPIRGELRDSSGYVWSLPGAHSARSRLTRHHAAAESRLIAATGLARGPVLDLAWRSLIQAQFHDTICGSVSDPVAAEQSVRLDGIRALADETIRSAVFERIGHDPDRAREAPDRTRPVLAVWNPAQGPFAGVVVAETTWFDRDVLVGPPGNREPNEGLGYRAFHLVAPDGAPMPVQVLRVAPGLERVDASRHYPDLDQVDRVWVAAWTDNLPGRQVAVLSVKEGSGPDVDLPNPVWCRGSVMDNGLIRVQMGRHGLVALTDAATGQVFAGLLGIESESDRGDLYTPEVEPRTNRQARVRRVRPLAAGPLVAALEAQWSVAPGPGGVVHGRTVVSLEAGAAAAKVRVEFDNHAADHRLRIRLPGAAPAGIEVGAPLGTEHRGPGRGNRSWPEEATLPTAPAQGFLRSAGPVPPFQLDWPGFFEYELGSEGDVALTLCRSVGQLSRTDNRNRLGHAGWATATPAAQEPGRHVVEFSIAPARGYVGPTGVHPIWIRAAYLSDPIVQAPPPSLQ